MMSERLSEKVKTMQVYLVFNHVRKFIAFSKVGKSTLLKLEKR